MNDDDRDKSIEDLRRELERELDSLDRRDEPRRRRGGRPSSYRDEKARSQELSMRIIAGLCIAAISFMATEMYDFHNQLIGIDQKMRLLVTPDFQIVPSGKHASHELARETLGARITSLEGNIKFMMQKLEETEGLGERMRQEHMTECLRHLTLLREEAGKLKEGITSEYRREISQEIKMIERRIEGLSRAIKEDRDWI